MRCNLCRDKGTYYNALGTVIFCRKCERGKESKIAQLEYLINFYEEATTTAQEKVMRYQRELTKVKSEEWG